jgi:hypothetical protein
MVSIANQWQRRNESLRRCLASPVSRVDVAMTSRNHMIGVPYLMGYVMCMVDYKVGLCIYIYYNVYYNIYGLNITRE